MNKINRKKQKSRKEHIEEVLIEQEKDCQISQSQYKERTRQYKNTLGF